MRIYILRKNTGKTTESGRESTSAGVRSYKSAQLRLSRRDVWAQKCDTLKKDHD